MQKILEDMKIEYPELAPDVEFDSTIFRPTFGCSHVNGQASSGKLSVDPAARFLAHCRWLAAPSVFKHAGPEADVIAFVYPRL